MTIRIGLTGPTGCGKSTVGGWLEELGAHAIDADEVARAVTAPGEPALDAVIARFGVRYRRPDGGLDRAALAELVFSDPAALDREGGCVLVLAHPASRIASRKMSAVRGTSLTIAWSTWSCPESG